MDSACSTCTGTCGSGAGTGTAGYYKESPADDPRGVDGAAYRVYPRRELVRRPAGLPLGVPRRARAGHPERLPRFSPGPSSVCPLSQVKTGQGERSRVA